MAALNKPAVKMIQIGMPMHTIVRLKKGEVVVVKKKSRTEMFKPAHFHIAMSRKKTE